MSHSDMVILRPFMILIYLLVAMQFLYCNPSPAINLCLCATLLLLWIPYVNGQSLREQAHSPGVMRAEPTACLFKILMHNVVNIYERQCNTIYFRE